MFVGAYWGKRKEARDECAKRIFEILNRVRGMHPTLEAWFLKGRKKSGLPDSAVEFSLQQISRILRTNNRDTDGQPIPELGFSIGVWNGKHELSASFSASCGGWSNLVKNSAVLDFDSSWNENNFLSQDRMREVLVEFIRAFEPDVAVVTSHEYLDRAGGGAPWEAGGWLVYDRSRDVHEMLSKALSEEFN